VPPSGPRPGLSCPSRLNGGAHETSSSSARNHSSRRPAADRGRQGKTVRPNKTAKATYHDIEKTLGIVPTFFRRFPPESIEGGWEEFKSLQLSPSTHVGGKYKELIAHRTELDP
jgi:hypothetical protein